jgi:hypothetical protein
MPECENYFKTLAAKIFFVCFFFIDNNGHILRHHRQASQTPLPRLPAFFVLR